MMATATVTRPRTGYTLHPYQKRGVAQVESLLPEPTLLVAPTGAGKTVMAAEIARRYRTVLVVAHRSELIAQSHKVMGSHVMSMSILSALNYGPTNIQLLIIDEAHRADAATYRKLIEKYADVPRLGLTATPWRMDGRGLTDAFSHLVSVSNVKDLLDAGYLVPYLPLEAPDEALAQLPHLRKVGGDYDAKQLSALVNTPRLVGNVVEEYKRHALGRAAVAFAVGITHSLSMAAAFNTAGIRAVHIDGRDSADVRAGALRQLAARKIDVVCNVNLFTEGWDCKEVSCVIMARPTASLTLYLQCVGRGMRPDAGEKRDLVILDHAGNIARHGYPDEDREWSLEGRDQRAKREAEVAELKRLAELGFESLEQYELEQKRLREEIYYSARQVANLLSGVGIRGYWSFLRSRGVNPSSTNGMLSTYLRSDVDAVIAEFRDSYSSIDAAKLLGFSRGAAKDTLRRHGIAEINGARATKECRWPKNTVDSLAAIYSGCISATKAASILGLSVDRAREVMAEAQIFAIGNSIGRRYRKSEIEALAKKREDVALANFVSRKRGIRAKNRRSLLESGVTRLPKVTWAMKCAVCGKTFQGDQRQRRAMELGKRVCCSRACGVRARSTQAQKSGALNGN